MILHIIYIFLKIKSCLLMLISNWKGIAFKGEERNVLRLFKLSSSFFWYFDGTVLNFDMIKAVF